MAANCSPRGDQIINLDRARSEGLKSLKQRVTTGDLVVIQTDKSGNFGACSPLAYENMGLKHTSEDLEITPKEVEVIQRRLNHHTSMWMKMVKLGDNWGHQDRMRETLIHHSHT